MLILPPCTTAWRSYRAVVVMQVAGSPAAAAAVLGPVAAAAAAASGVRDAVEVFSNRLVVDASRPAAASQVV